MKMWKWRNKEIIMERYFVTNQNMIYKKNKYEIGKRYKVIQDIIENYPFYDSFNTIPENVIYIGNFRIFIIKIYKTLSGKWHAFKILKEINYEIICNDKSVQKIEILAIKTRNEKILKDFLDSRMAMESQIAINCGMADYAISHCLYKNNPNILKALANLGRNLILKMINDVELIKKHNLWHILIKHGRPQDLNFLLKMFSKRTYILMEIVKQGRKKDIDEIIRIEKMPSYLSKEIANIGFDEHLKILKNHK